MKDIQSKLKVLADAAKYDASCASSGVKKQTIKGGLGNSNGSGICHSYTPDGRCISLLKILMTNYCIYDCQFCINRVSSNTPRARMIPQEIADLTIEFYKRNYIEGLFLSSGIIQSADYTMEQLVQTAKILRIEKRFGGYIHLKAIAGASPELLRAAGLYADRLSANIELPRQSDLEILAPAKQHSTIESSMSVIKSAVDEGKEEKKNKRKKGGFSVAGQSTQLIVGATPASDLDLLNKASSLYKTQNLKRVYYSAFSPIPDSAPGVPSLAAPLMREHRLYQADWLQRFYHFSVDEIVSKETPHLDLDKDPKVSWALKHREFFPVNINTADKFQLLRVPGFGTRTVMRILASRRYQALRFEHLMRMRVPLNRAKYFIQTADKNNFLSHLERSDLLLEKKPVQLNLFESGTSALLGEL